MENISLKAADIVARLAGKNRVIVLGGIAVILHGLPRATKDVDLWLDPTSSEQLWAQSLRQVIEAEHLTASRIGHETGMFVPIRMDEIASTVAKDRFLRILAADRPIDIFRIPNQLDVSDFDDVWNHSRELPDGTRLIDEIDLVVTKMDTGRIHDEADIRFLHDKIEKAYMRQIRTCSVDEAAKLFERFADPDIAAFAATDAEDQAVSALGLDILNELSNDGNPYATQLMEDIKTKLERKHGRHR